MLYSHFLLMLLGTHTASYEYLRRIVDSDFVITFLRCPSNINGDVFITKKIKQIPINRNRTNENLCLTIFHGSLLLILLLFPVPLEGVKGKTHKNRDVA